MQQNSKQPIFRHSNLSASSTGSAKRLSSNNPFRSALLQEEAIISKDSKFKEWMDQRIDEESASDGNSFSEDSDLIDFASERVHERPSLGTRGSDPITLRRRKSTNPFSDIENSRQTSTKNMRESTHPARNDVALPRNYDPDSFNDDSDLPPSYEEAVGRKYAKDEYPKDEKPPIPQRGSREESNVPPTATLPRRAKTVRASPTRRGRSERERFRSSSNNSNSHHHKKNITATTETRILEDGRIRSRSVGQASLDGKGRHALSESPPQHHHHHHHHHHHRPHKKFVMAKPKNLDTIDKLDVTGFYGGAKFHHDGPFDACTPHRNRDKSKAPVLAFPPDGPNNSIKGIAPVHSTDNQYDLLFGVGEDDPLYTTKISHEGSSTRQTRSHGSENSDYYTGKAPYGNGLIVKRATQSTMRLNEISNNPTVTRFDVNTKATPIHGDTTLGLGSSTFMEGAPASTATQKKAIAKEKERVQLGRKKSIMESNGFLRRVKSLKGRKSSRH